MKKFFIASAMILVVATILNSCSRSDKPGGSPAGDTSGMVQKTAIISGTVTISSSAAGASKLLKYTSYKAANYKATKRGSDLDRILSASGVKAAVELPPLINATMKLYNADRPDWIYPVAQVFSDAQGKFKFDKLTNSELNTDVNGNPEYSDGDPVPAGNYTIIAANDTTISGGKQFVAVQAFVKYFEGAASGNDLVVQDSDAEPSVQFLIGLKPNSNGTFGGAGATLAPNAGIQIIFDMAMARLSIIDAVKIASVDDPTTPISGSWKVTPNLQTATFYPSGGLAPSTEYTITIQGGDNNSKAAVNVFGRPISATVTGTFTSEAADDTTPPQNLVLYKPKQTNVAVTTPIQIASPEPIDINTITVASQPSIGDKPAIQYIGTKPVLTNQPDFYIYEIGHTPLKLNTNYVITISNVRDMASNQISPLTFTFKTEATSSGVTTTAGALQDDQLAVKDVFGKWVNAMNTRNAVLLTTYMSGNFFWLTNGWTEDDLNRDGRLSLNEFRGMLQKDFDVFDYCGTVISGDTSDITINASTASIAFALSFTNTANTGDPNCAAEPDQLKYAMLDNINGAWLVSRGSDTVTSTYPPALDAINLVVPVNGTQYPEPTPSKPLKPDFAWTAVSGVKTYALLIFEKGSSDKGWVALVDGSGYAPGDSVTFTFTNQTGYTGTSYVMPSGSLFGFSNFLDKFLPGGYYVWSVLGFKTSTVANFELDQVADPVADLSASSSPDNFSVTNNAPPSVLSVNPANTESGVSTSPTLSAVFSEAMDPATINDTTFTLEAQGGASVAGTVSYDDATYTATFVPATLADGTTYVARISTGAADIAANSLAVEYSWVFSTADTPDTTPPITTADPVGGTFRTNQTVRLNANENGAVIYYTTDGTTPTTSSTVYTGPISISAGTTTLKYFAVDTAGNSETPKSDTYIVDLTTPKTTASPLGGTYGSAQSVTLTVDDATASIHYTTDGSTPLITSPTYTTAINITSTTTLQYFAVDPAGNQENMQTQVYVIDDVPPDTTIISSPSGTSNNPYPSFGFSSTKVGTFECSIDAGGTWAACTSPYTQSTALPDGTYTFEVRAIDMVGNVDATPATKTWTIDTLAPTGSITISSGATYTTGVNVTLALTASSDVDLMQLSNDGSAWQDAESFAATKAWTLPSGDSSKSVFVRFKDTAGNWSTAYSSSIILDTTAPTGSIMIEDGAAVVKSTSVTLTLVAADANGVTGMQFSNDNTTWSAVVTYGTTTAWDLAAGADGTRTVYVKYQDTAGNWSSSYSDTITLDTTPPDTIIISTPSVTSNDLYPSFSFTSETGATFECSMDAGATWASCTNPYSQLTALSNGTTYTFEVRAIDAVGNIDPTPATFTWTIDTVAPTGNISINGVDTYTLTADVTLTLTAVSDVEKMQFSSDGSAWQDAEDFATTKSWTLSAGDATKYVYVRFKDKAGNWSNSYFDSIILDTTAPAGSIAIEDGAAYTKSTSVNLNLSAADANGVMEMQLSNDNSIWTVGSYATTTTWTMAAGSDGTRTVYVKFKDTAGNWSSAYSDSIILDSTAPVATIISTPSLTTNNPYPTFGFTSETGASFECKIDSGSYAACVSPVTYSSIALTDGAHTFSVRATDTNGNTGTDASYVWTVDTTAPAGQAVSGTNGISINAGAASTTSIIVTLTFSATDTNGVSQMQLSNDGISWYPAETYKTTKSNWVMSVGGSYTKTVYVKFEDNAGNWSSAYSDTILLIPGPPETVASPLTGTYTSGVSVSLTAISNNPPATTYYTVDGTTDPACNLAIPAGTVYTVPITISATTTLQFCSKDSGAYEATKTETYTIDPTAPSGSFTITGNAGASAGYTNTVSVTLNLSGITDNVGGSGMSTMQFSNDGIYWSTLETFNSTKPWIIPSSDGIKRVFGRFYDAAGNSYATSATITLDTVVPTTVASPSGGLYNSSPSVTLNASETSTIKYTTNGSDPTVSGLTYGGPITIALTSNLRYYATDLAGNAETVKTEAYTIDTTLPTGTIAINGGALYTNTRSVTLTLSASDANGVTQMMFSDDGGVTYTSPETYSTTRGWTLSIGDGPKSVYVKFVDGAGNISNPVSASITYDTTAPTSPSIAIHNGADYTYTNTTTITLDLSATDSSGLSQMLLSYDGTNWYLYTYSATKSWTIPAGDGTKTVYARFKDNAGNWSGSTNDTIVLDTTTPTGSIAIQGGAGVTNTTSVNLTLSASDLNGVVMMQFSNNGSSWSSAEAYATAKAWTLTTGDGTKTVYVKYQDNAGNWSVAYNNSITLDTAAPDTTLTGSPPSLSNTAYPVFSFTSTEAGSSFLCKMDAFSWTACSSPTGYSLVEGTHTFRVQAIDPAGNPDPTPATYTWTIDTTAPSSLYIQIHNGTNYTYTNTTSVTLDLSAYDASGVTQMQLSNDGVNWYTYAYTTSMMWGIASGDGTKTVYVKYKDAAGNWSAATYDTIILDTAPPNTSITSYPSNPSTYVSYIDGLGNPIVRAWFYFSSSETGSSFYCSLDGGAYAACGSGLYYDFPNGVSGHSFSVYAVDGAGNADSTPASYAWTINTTGQWDTSGYYWDQHTWGY